MPIEKEASRDSSHAAAERKGPVGKKRFSTRLSIVPLLITGQSISPKIRQALRENRLRDAAQLIIQEYGLNCVEASQLLDISACDR
jgi:hypothetical protein